MDIKHQCPPFYGGTWQDIFAIPASRSKNATISVELVGNTAKIRWRPKFIVYEYLPDGSRRRCRYGDIGFTALVRSVFNGVLRWDSRTPPNPDPLVIDGVSGQVTVEILDADGKLYDPKDAGFDCRFDAKNFVDSNVALYLGKPDKAIVWDTFFWRRNKKLRVKICSKESGCSDYSALSRVMEHEFGHVLGLFDAYGYADKPDPADGSYHYGGHPWPDGLLPPALIDGQRLKRNSVMVCDYCAPDETDNPARRFTRTSIDYEMMLFAWRYNKLQLFTNSILGKKSQAFFH